MSLSQLQHSRVTLTQSPTVYVYYGYLLIKTDGLPCSKYGTEIIKNTVELLLQLGKDA